MRVISTLIGPAFLDKGGLAMGKRNILIWLLVGLLLLPSGALAAGVMGAGERLETLPGEETPFLPAVSETAASAPVSAQLSDAGHTAADHAAWSPLSAAGTLESGSYYLTGNVTGNLIVAANATVDLCLDGHTLDAAGSGSVITVNAGATLNLYDCPGGGKVTGGNASVGGGVNINGSKTAASTLNLYGGSIEGNSANNGGGVRVSNGSFTMYGGSVAKNIASTNGGGVLVTSGSFALAEGTADVTDNSAKSGGGIYAAANSSLNISGGVITKNAASTGGGGVYLYGVSTLNMSAGSILNNTATGKGGGICLDNGSVSLSGGTVSDNVSGGDGGGILVSASGAISISGDPSVTGNKKSDDSANNVYLATGETIAFGGAMVPATASLGITMSSLGVFTDVGCAEQRTCFFSDNADYAVGADSEGQLFLGGTLTYHVPTGATGTVPAPTVYPVGERVTLDTTYPLSKEGYQQTAWTGSVDTVTTRLAVTISKNTTVYPVFARAFEATEKGTTISLTYNTPMSETNLNDYLRLVDSTGGATTNFGFSLPSGQTLPAGLTLDRNSGKITGTPKADCGSHNVTFLVTDRSATVTLFSLEPSPAYRTATLTLDFDIAKGTPSAADFTFAPPADLTYNGAAKAASVTAKSGIAGMGAITVKYSATPVAKGTYTVSIDVAEGTNYRAVTGLTDPSWTFTITEAAPAKVNLGTPQWANGRTTIALTPTPANLLTGAKVIAARYDANGAMTDLAWGTLSGNTVTFSGKQLTVNSGWKLFFLKDSNCAPLCSAEALK